MTKQQKIAAIRDLVTRRCIHGDSWRQRRRRKKFQVTLAELSPWLPHDLFISNYGSFWEAVEWENDEYDDDHKASLKSIQTDAQWLGRDMIENQDEVTVDFIYDHMQNWL